MRVMMWVFGASTFIAGCAVSGAPPMAAAEGPVSSSSSSTSVSAAAAMQAAQGRRLTLRRGRLAQGGVSFWRAEEGAKVYLDDRPVAVDGDGHFVLGFDRDHALDAELLVVYADGSEERRQLAVEDREFKISRIDGLDPSKVNTYTEEQLAQIRRESAMKSAARQRRAATSYWRAGFDWPVRARISSRYGNQRILNGIPKRFHSGTDIAAPTGTPVKAPSTGKVTLAETDFYFEGGVIFIDHGQTMESVMMHLSRVDVRPGQIVTKGEVIGAVGSTGRSTGPHLHWTVNWQGKPMDPELLVPPMADVDTTQ